MKPRLALCFLLAATVVCATASSSHDQNDKRELLSNDEQPFDITAESITKVIKKAQDVAESITNEVRNAQDVDADSIPTEQVGRYDDLQAEWDILNEPLQDPHSAHADAVLNRAISGEWFEKRDAFLGRSQQEIRGAPDACSDVLTTTFLDVNNVKRNCAWLADQLIIDFNRANLLYCGKAGGFILKDYRTPLAAVVCPVTCDRPCTYEESTCKDSSALIGSSEIGRKKKKKCNWIKKSAKRLARYCSAEEGIRSRGDAACPKTCGKCGQLSASMMTEAPSNAPSALPTVSASPSSTPTAFPTVTISSNPSATPSFSPSALPSSPVPSEQPSVMPSLTESAEPSAMPSSEPSVKASSNPSVTPSSKPSINESTSPSNIPSATPTTTKTSAPSTNPSATPTNRPSVSLSPSPSPTEQPTSSPTSAPTYDLEKRATDRQAQCGSNLINTYDFSSRPAISAACDVCVSTKECNDAGGSVYCCKWTWGQLCMDLENIWTEKQIQRYCIP